MAVGVLDCRRCVKIAAARALYAALRDRHIHVVPVDVVVTILSTILVHTASQLNDDILERSSRSRANDVTAAISVNAASSDSVEDQHVAESPALDVSGSAAEVDSSMIGHEWDDIEISEIILRAMCEV